MGNLDGGSELDSQQAERSSPLHTTLENNNDSWPNSLRRPPASKSRARENLSDSMHSAFEENSGLKGRDVASETKTQKYAGQRDLTSKYGDPGVDQRPSTSNGRPRQTIQYSDIPGVNERGSRRPSAPSRREDRSVPSNLEVDKLPAPRGRQRMVDSRNELSTSATSRRALRSESMPNRISTVVDSRTAAVKGNGYHGSNGHRMSSSASRRENLTIPSSREGDILPAPHRPHRISDSHNELRTSATSKRALRSESMPNRTSRVVDPRTVENGKHSFNGKHSSKSASTNFSHRHREPSPASILRHSRSDSLPLLSTSHTSSKTTRSESMRHQGSSGMESRTAARSESMSHQKSSGVESRSTARSESMRYQRSSGMDSRTGAATEDGSRRPTMALRREYLSNPSTRDKESSPTPIRYPDSRAEMITRDSKSHSRSISSSRDSKTGARVYVPPQGGDSTNLNSKQEAVGKSSRGPRLVRAKSGTIDGSHLGETLQGDGYNNPISLREQYQGKARSGSTDESKTEPSTSASIRARLAAAAIQNLRATDPGGPSRRLRQECESDYKRGTRQRSITRDKSRKGIEDACHFSVTNSFEKSAQENFSPGSHREGRTNRSKSASNRLYSRKRLAANASLDFPLSKVAAASYNGGSLPFNEMVPFPDDIANLNKFLSDCRRDVEAGLPGKALMAVIGQENSDLDSIVSTIAYAYFLSYKGNDELRYYAPVINIREKNFVLHTDAIWLLKSSGVDTSNLIFVDQISLLYYHKFGCLSLVLVDHSKLASHQKGLEDAVISIIDHNVPESVYPWVSDVLIEQVGSCCTLIAEKYASEAPEHLKGRGISRLLLGAIIVDTANLDDKFSRSTTRDEVMAAFLIHGAGRYGLQGLFRHLRHLRFDISVLSTKDVLKKEFKPWTLGPGKTDLHGWKGTPIPAAMSSIGVPLVGFLSRKDIVHDLKRFQRRMKLDLHLIMTGYYDDYDRYQREILVVPRDIDLAEQIVTCFSEHKDRLRLSSVRMKGLPEDMLVYKQGQVTASRKVIIQILVNYFAQ